MQRVSHGQKLAAGIGGVHETLATHAASQIAYPIFNLALGVSPAAVGIALAVPRLWDAFIDPWIGAVSDRTRSRLGRRRPYMFAASAASGLLFAAMWWFPRGMGTDYYFWHFLVTALLFSTASAFFTVPWQALLAEMTPDYHERTRVQAVRSILATFGALLMPWLFWTTQRPLFVDAIEGMRWVGIAQRESTLLWLRILFPLVPTVSIAGAIVLLCFYPITEEKARVVRQQIEANRLRTRPAVS